MLALLEQLARDQDEAHAGHTLEALVRRGRHGRERNLVRVQRQGAESTHRVDDQGPFVRGHDLGDLLDRIEDPGGGLAVDHGDMGDALVAGQLLVH